MFCDDCKHTNTKRCFKCVRHVDILDYYERISKEEQIKRARQEIISGRINIGVSDSFKKIFYQATKACTFIPDKPIFLTVHASENSLVASDGYLLVELNTDVPNELINKNIVKIEENQVDIYDKPYPDYETLFNKHMAVAKTAQLPNIMHFPHSFSNTRFIMPDGLIILIREKHFALAADCLIGDISISYCPKEKNGLIVLTGDNGRAIIAPLKQEE